jgi:hypothetical protein
MRLAHNRELAGLLTALGKLLTRARQLMAAPPNPLQMTREDNLIIVRKVWQTFKKMVLILLLMTH